MSARTTRVIALPLLALALALPACDLYEPSLDDFAVVLQVDELPVDLGSGVSAPVRPNRPTAASADVATDFDVEAVEDLESISLDPEMFSFTPGAAVRTARGGSGAASGTITGYVFVGGVPVPGTPVTVTITDGAVTDVSPRVIASAASTLDAEAIEDFVASLPQAERPDLGDWQSMTVEELRDEIRAALSGATIPIAFGLEVTSADPLDPLTGTITLNEIDVSAVISR